VQTERKEWNELFDTRSVAVGWNFRQREVRVNRAVFWTGKRYGWEKGEPRDFVGAEKSDGEKRGVVKEKEKIKTINKNGVIIAE